VKLVIVSGLSGSGKTVALHTLEDAGYYCIDNLPLSMLPELVDKLINSSPQPYDLVAIAVDARSRVDNSDRFDEVMRLMDKHPLQLKVLFLTADTARLLKRFSETRRKHPLSREGLPLADAIKQEKTLLEDIHANADISIDSSNLNVHELRQMLIDRLVSQSNSEMGILIQSFGFKNGVPADSDFVFDVRCLPNPHWRQELRPLTGKDPEVAGFLEQDSKVRQFRDDIIGFLERWIPCFEADGRSYLTVAIGCTGGQHRSVYLVEQLAAHFRDSGLPVLSRHRELT